MPDQIKRLLILATIVLILFIALRKLFIPATFGVYGHYRAAAVDSISALPINYAGHKACLDCHDDIEAVKSKSYHRWVNCEACHGPGEEHIQSGGDVRPTVPRDRAHCVLCHTYDPAKPTGYPQIDPVAHNPVKPCITCHNPHAPDPPYLPDACSACHTGIAKTKALSPHALLECTVCHDTPDEHKLSPRAVRPGKPVSRADCTKCHARDADADKFIPRIEAASHGEKNLCWDCHFPHYPEAK